MFPKSRGGASVVALAVAALVLMASLWFAFAGPGSETKAGPGGETREPGSGSPAGPGAEVLDRADDLLKQLSEGSAPPTVPDGLRFYRPAEDQPVPVPGEPGIESMTGRLDGFLIRLAWSPSGAAAGGYLVERLGTDGEPGAPLKLGPDARTCEGGPVDALSGSRLYRVTPLRSDDTVADGAAREQLVAWEIGAEISYLGLTAEGAGRFLVRLSDHGEDAAREFAVSSGEVIGGKSDAIGPIPALDWSTGFAFRGLRGRRLERNEKVKVPRFGPDGSLARAESGEVLYEDKELPVSEVVEEAMILHPGAPEDVRWLPEMKD